MNILCESTGFDECNVLVAVREVGDLSAAVGTERSTSKLREGRGEMSALANPWVESTLHVPIVRLRRILCNRL